MNATPLERLLAKVEQDPDTGCWNWTGSLSNRGYGFFWFDRPRMAHCVSYELHVGPVPDGLVLDHVCRNRRCVNPAHLEPVTMRENLLRGESFSGRNARMTHCVRGHEFTEANTYRPPKRPTERQCKTCRHDASLARSRKQEVAA